MAILAECPTCHKKQAVKNKVCKCGHDLNKAKRSAKVRYWVSYHLPAKRVIRKDGTEKTVYPQRREICDRENPFSIELARAADGKRKAQKVETPSILERLPEETMTFKELSDWYLKRFRVRAKVEDLRDTKGPKVCLDNFNALYGDRIVRTITVGDLEDYREQRKQKGRALSTIDKE